MRMYRRACSAGEDAVTTRHCFGTQNRGSSTMDSASASNSGIAALDCSRERERERERTLYIPPYQVDSKSV